MAPYSVILIFIYRRLTKEQTVYAIIKCLFIYILYHGRKLGNFNGGGGQIFEGIII